MKNKLHFFDSLDLNRVYKSGPESMPASAEMGLNFEGQVNEWLTNPEITMEEIAKALEDMSLSDLKALTAFLDEQIRTVEQDGALNQENDLNSLRTIRLSVAKLALESWSSEPKASMEDLLVRFEDLSPKELEELRKQVYEMKRYENYDYSAYKPYSNEVDVVSQANDHERARLADLEKEIEALSFKKQVEAEPDRATDLMIDYLNTEKAKDGYSNYWDLLPSYATVLEKSGLEVDKKKLESSVLSGIKNMLDINWEGATECAIARFKAAESLGLIHEKDFLRLVEQEFSGRIQRYVSRVNEVQNWESKGDNMVAAIVLSKDIGRVKSLGLPLNVDALRAQFEQGILSYVERSELPADKLTEKVKAFVKPYQEYTFSDLNLSEVYAAIKRKSYANPQ